MRISYWSSDFFSSNLRLRGRKTVRRNLHRAMPAPPVPDGDRDDLAMARMQERNCTMIWKKPALFRRSISGAALLVLAACSNVAQAATYTMFRDPGCGCCLKERKSVVSGKSVSVGVELGGRRMLKKNKM